mgnify:CR=1 FL=1
MDFELWILDSFSIFLRFEISENFSYDDGVVEVSVIEVHIRQEDGQCWILDGGWWIHSEFKIAHSKFRSLCGVCVSKRSWGVLILDFGF